MHALAGPHRLASSSSCDCSSTLPSRFIPCACSSTLSSWSNSAVRDLGCSRSTGAFKCLPATAFLVNGEEKNELVGGAVHALVGPSLSHCPAGHALALASQPPPNRPAGQAHAHAGPHQPSSISFSLSLFENEK